MKKMTAHENYDLSTLKPNPKNPKEHTKQQLEHLANSLKTFDWTQPIVVDEDNNILIGHGRWMAANMAAITTGPVWVVSGYTENEKKALMVVDNKLNMDTGWVMENLKELMLDINIEGVDIADLGIDFDFAATMIDPEKREQDVDTVDAKLDVFNAATVKQIVLLFENNVFEEVVAKCNQIIDNPPAGKNFVNNTEVFLWALETASEEHGY